MRLEEIEISKELQGIYIFLSASFPSVDRDERYYIETNPLDISDAVVSIVENILSRSGIIIFGGHPTISPLILTVSRNFIPYFKNTSEPIRIYIYQSEIYRNKISKYTYELLELGIGQIIWTENMTTTDKSNYQMRIRMLKDRKLSAAIFVGGMEGIKEEFSLFQEFYPSRPFYIFGSTGGASKVLFKENFEEFIEWKPEWSDKKENLLYELYNSKMYPDLVKKVISDITLGI